MRIELNAGGLGGAFAISGFKSDFSSMIKKSKSVKDSFVSARNSIYNMNGGVGRLQPAVESIGRRISNEEDKITNLEDTQRQINEFIKNTEATDKRVSEIVDKNKDEFYKVNPWAKPSIQDTVKKWLEKAKKWLVSTVKAAIDFRKKMLQKLKDFGQAVVDTIKKGFESTIAWIKEHKQQLIEIAIGIAVIVLAAVTGGTALAVITAISACSGSVISGIFAALTGGDVFDAMATGFMSGAISGFIGGHIGAFAGAHNFGKAATIAIDVISNGASSAGSEIIHAVSDGTGIDDAEKKAIITSAVISMITSGIKGGWKYKNNPNYLKESAYIDLKENDATFESYKESIKKEAVKRNRMGESNSYYNAQNELKFLRFVHDTKTEDIIYEEIWDSSKNNFIDGSIGVFRDKGSAYIKGVFNKPSEVSYA